MNLTYQRVLLPSGVLGVQGWPCPRVACGLRTRHRAQLGEALEPFRRDPKCRTCSERVETGRAPRAQWAPHGWHQCSRPLRPAGTRVQVKICDSVLSWEKGGHESTCQGVTAMSESACVNHLDPCLVCSKPSTPAGPRSAHALPTGGVVRPDRWAGPGALPSARTGACSPDHCRGHTDREGQRWTPTHTARAGPVPASPLPGTPRPAVSPEGRADLTRASPSPRWQLCYLCWVPEVCSVRPVSPSLNATI